MATTTNLDLYKPEIGETGWGTLFNDNLDALDVSASPGPLVRYVDYANGDDSYTGKSTSRAYKTIQAAYDALKTYANANYTAVGNDLSIGRLVLLPGDHDVGAGFLMDGVRPAEIVGFKPGLHYVPYNSQSRIVSSSASATYMMKVSPSVGTVGHGGRFYDLAFQMSSSTNTALTQIIYSDGIDYLHVERCGFRDAQSATTAVCAIYHVSNGDSSWARIHNNNANHMQFYNAPASTVAGNGTNQNRNYIHENVVFYNHATIPIVKLGGDWFQGSVSFNNLEGTACAVEIGPTQGGLGDFNTFFQNSGESDNTNPFYRFLTHTNGVSGPNHNIIIGGVCSSPAAIGTFADFSAGSSLNTVIGNYDYVGTSGYKRKIVDNSSFGNQIINPNYGVTTRYESSAAPAISDADFTQGNPWNGTMGVTHNTGSGEDRLWARVNGAWKSVVLS